MINKKVENVESEYSASAGNIADFETAISATSFGVFNLILLLITIPSIFSSQFEIGSLSYVFPAAQCDLNLSLEDRGLLNAIVYAGMIGSCFIWGSLIDVFGRRKILIIAHFLECIFIVMAAFAPNLSTLIAAKFFGGFIINGSTMALTPYLSEFHGVKYRSRVPLTIGLVYSTGNIFLPLLAWAILPLSIQFNVFGNLEFHAWNMFLLFCMLPTLASGIFFTLMSESPKYLMTKGNNEKALEVFQKIFKLNTGQTTKQYPFKELIDDKQIYQEKKSVKSALKQISPLFTAKYLPKLVLACLLTFFLMLCINSLRLWLPEMFQLMNDYEPDNNETSSFCRILDTIRTVSDHTAENCSMNFNNSSVYINSIIVGLTAVVSYIVTAFCVNKLGKKTILISLGLVSAVSVACVYFAPDTLTAVALICVHLASSCICVDLIITIIVDLFPTYLRASALSLALMSGRIGSVLGNLIFPILLQAGCGAQFFTLGSVIVASTLLSLFLPNTDFIALQ